VLKGGIGCQADRVIQPRHEVDAELKLHLFDVGSPEALEEECAQAGSDSTVERVEDEEALETRAGSN
jgi:hypothetical protein